MRRFFGFVPLWWGSIVVLGMFIFITWNRGQLNALLQAEQSRKVGEMKDDSGPPVKATIVMLLRGDHESVEGASQSLSVFTKRFNKVREKVGKEGRGGREGGRGVGRVERTRRGECNGSEAVGRACVRYIRAAP